MQRLTGAQILCESLIKEGVDTIFGMPGGAIIPLYDTLFQYPFRHILCRHEQGASHMADGYARITGNVGVCLGTSGPGATNLVTGIATAMMDSVPMVAITGQVPTYMIGKDAMDGKLTPKKKAADTSTVDRGKSPGARSDVSAKGRLTESQKREKRLENVAI